MALKHILPLHKKDAPTASGEPKSGHPSQHRTRQSWITNRWRNELVAAAAEFAGTFMFLFFAFGGTSVANTAALYSDSATAGQESGSITQAPNTSVLLYISLIFGFSLMVNVWVFFRVSGGLFNPAASLSTNGPRLSESADSSAGHSWSLSHRCDRRNSRRALFCFPNVRWHGGRGCHSGHPPRPAQRLYHPGVWGLGHPRRLS